MRKSVILSFVVMVSLFFAAMTPAVVFAEGEAPEATPPVESPVVTTTEVVSAAVQTLAENGAALMDAEASTVPLASQAALKILCDPDPWFYGACPGGKCTGYTTINDALADWGTYKGKGFIYLEGDFVGAEDVIIDGGIYPEYLTLKGIVWDTKTLGDKPRLDGHIYVLHLNSGFTLQGIDVFADYVLNAINFEENTGTIKLTNVSATNSGGPGLSISTNGPIFLNQVTAVENKGTGATLSNIFYNGTKYIPSNVTILNSSFMRNAPEVGSTIALIIGSYGNIMLNGVTAVGNDGGGVDFNARGKSLFIKNSVFSNNSASSGSPTHGYGIWVTSESTASITLDNVVLNGNDADGAFLSTSGNITLKKVYAANNGSQGVLISSAYNTEGAGAKNVTILDSSFNRNGVTNLEIYASGAVKVINLSSTYSQTGSGLWVDNSYALNAAPVTIQGAVVNENGDLGVFVYYTKGTITISGIIANRNGGTGVYLDNSIPGGIGSVVVLGSLGLNQFNNNIGSGLYIKTNQNVNLTSIQAIGNDSYGIAARSYATNGSITLVNVEADGNCISHPDFAGVRIRTSGNVSLIKVVAIGNVSKGISIQNNETPIARTVKISSSTANDNEGYGISIESVGAITLTGVTASGNSHDGANLVNSVMSLPTQVPQGITVVKSTFNSNNGDGLYLLSQSKITLASIRASGNTNSGVSANNDTSPVSSPIVVSGVNYFTSNSNNGMCIASAGNVSISGVTSNGNMIDGIYAFTTSGVTLKNSQLEGNGWTGVFLFTRSNIILSGLTVMQNGFGGLDYPGIYVYTTGIMIISSSTVMANSGYGLEIDVLNKYTDAKIASNVVVFGNDAGADYDDGNVWVD